jgi:ATP-dependent helicase/DNAse subunit B
MEEQKTEKNAKMTTIKLSPNTKERLDKLRAHKRETYEDILQNILDTLNLVKINPLKARSKLVSLDKFHRKSLTLNDKSSVQKRNPQPSREIH